MAKKIFTYRGKTVDELQTMSITEIAQLLTSSARRKITRGFTEAEKIALTKIAKKDGVKTHCRDLIVLPFMFNKLIKVSRGNSFDEVRIVPEMIGMRFGELVLTRKKLSHGQAGLGASKGTANQNRK